MSAVHQNQEIPHFMPSWKRWILLISLGAIGLASIFALLVSTGAYLYINPRYQAALSFDLEKLERDNHAQDGVRYEDIASHFLNALVSAEDPGFYERQVGISRLTIQLISKSFSEEKSHAVKLCLAHRIEKELEKEQILELYINRLYFGNGYYGIGAAAKGYFGKSPKSLSVAESAALAGVFRAPHDRSPRLFPDACKKTRDYVLGLMVEQGYIDRETRDLARNVPVVVVSQPVSYNFFK